MEYSLKMLPYNSILLAMYGGTGTIGKNAILKTKATLNQSVCAVLPNKYKYDSKYLLYFMQYFRYKWVIFANSSRKDPNINQDAILNLFTILPPLNTQTKIATYLDQKTQTIDKEITLLEQKTAKYRELKQTLINETILRGLDRAVKLKESGVEWIGEIPEGCEVKRLKDIIIYIYSGATPTSNNMSYWLKGIISWCNIGDMRRNKFLNKTDKKLTQIGFKSKSLKLIPEDTILYSIYATLGRVNITRISTTINQAILAIFENKKKINKYYLAYYLEFLQIHMMLFANFNTQYNLNAEIVKNFIVIVPDLKEQIQIANYLDEKPKR